VLTTPFRIERRVIPDGVESVRDTIIDLADVVGCDLVLTTGGTGRAADLTPEATRAPVLANSGVREKMRMASLAQTPTAILSRQLAAQRGKCLVINLPGARVRSISASTRSWARCLLFRPDRAAYIETTRSRLKRSGRRSNYSIAMIGSSSRFRARAFAATAQRRGRDRSQAISR